MAKDKEKPLTLNGLIEYNKEVLFPFLKETFVGKKEFRKFKNDMMGFKDEALEKLGNLTQEKIIGDAQDKRQKKVLEIHNNALKKSNILSEEEVLEIDKLRAF